jgi:5'-3' exonuclease
MGVPSYFSYIIRNYPNIIRDWSYFLQNQNFQFHHLFMDCNSIIYDAFHSLDLNEVSHLSIDDRIINKVCANINEYISYIKPTKTLYISFDGVAPLAKMEQQRTRRHRSHFLSSLQDKEAKWDTCAITPGTEFMRKLTSRIRYDFKEGYKNIYKTQNIVISSSDEPGEGEHKLFQYVRNNGVDLNDNAAVYGLDSDLIMLSLYHLKYCKNMFIFRDTPEFFKSKLIFNKSNYDIHFLDIAKLSTSIQSEMSCSSMSDRRVYDYVFMCYLLGNDFLPHFPSLNIRTHGMGVLLDVYRMKLGNHYNKFFIDEKNRINWQNVKLFIYELVKNEKDFLTKEYMHREQYYKNKLHQKKMDEEERVNNLPLFYRTEEMYICPQQEDWENRYYKSLFHMNRVNNNSIKDICINYLEGLEWVHYYYTTGCLHWKWKYKYHYPPLLSDLVRCIPNNEFSFIENNRDLRKYENKSFTDTLQLCYVLPKKSFHLLSKKGLEITKKNSDYYVDSFEFQWAFCRFFWESHVLLPEIKTTTLENWNMILVN